MPTHVSVNDFGDDLHGVRYMDVVHDPVDGPALAAALRVMNQPESIKRMLEAISRYDVPPLAGTVREIESEPLFAAACRGRRNRPSSRLKQAVGVACKLIMAKHGFAPKDLKSGKPDMGRMERFSKMFATARKYRQA